MRKGKKGRKKVKMESGQRKTAGASAGSFYRGSTNDSGILKMMSIGEEYLLVLYGKKRGKRK
jgi:hypothetical protein